MYCFQKKDGTVKKYYKEAIDYILTATVQKHEIMVGRSDEVGKIYECYTTKRKRFLETQFNLKSLTYVLNLVVIQIRGIAVIKKFHLNCMEIMWNLC